MATDMGLDEVKDVMMTLESNDGKKFTLQRHFAILSEVVKTALETDTSCVEMKLDVKGEVLERIVQWLNNHQGIEPAEIEKPVKSKVTAEWLPGREWDQKYIDGLAEPNIQVLYDVMLVSNLFLSLFSLFSFGVCFSAFSLLSFVLPRLHRLPTTWTSSLWFTAARPNSAPC